MLRLETVVYIPEPLYYYMYRENSLLASSTIQDNLKTFDLVLDRYNKYFKIFQGVSNVHLIKAALVIIITAHKQGFDIDTKKYENVIKEHITNIIFNNDFSINEKKQCLLVYMGIANLYYRYKYKNYIM